eukprot:jgi/Bigna1/91879/estExt_fgenesh1_pg.C_1270013
MAIFRDITRPAKEYWGRTNTRVSCFRLLLIFLVLMSVLEVNEAKKRKKPKKKQRKQAVRDPRAMCNACEAIIVEVDRVVKKWRTDEARPKYKSTMDQVIDAVATACAVEKLRIYDYPPPKLDDGRDELVERAFLENPNAELVDIARKVCQEATDLCSETNLLPASNGERSSPMIMQDGVPVDMETHGGIRTDVSRQGPAPSGKSLVD